MGTAVRTINTIQRMLGWIGITLVLLVANVMTGIVLALRALCDHLRNY